VQQQQQQQQQEPQSSNASLQAGGDNKALDIKVPAGITRLFKSNLDWQLYSDNQKTLDDRKVVSLINDEAINRSRGDTVMLLEW
jgi:hypothetical protein